MTRSRSTHQIVVLVLSLALVVTACGGGDETPAPAIAATTLPAPDTMADASMAPESMPESSESSMPEQSESPMPESSESSMADESGAAMDDLPTYQTLAITDVDGVTFTLGDFAGTPVFVEAFATWCPTCRSQLGVTDEAAGALGDAAVVLALSVETDLSSADVASYAAENGFGNIRFAVMSPEMLGALVEQFGNSIANPPSTPKFVIDAMGRAGGLTTGRESVDDIVAVLQGASA